MKTQKHFAATSAVALFAMLSAMTVSGANSITFDNKSEKPALVKLVGPTTASVSVENGKTETVSADAGHYYIKVRYGTPGTYVYSKGDEFDVTETATSSSKITITLHKVVDGNYGARPISENEFGAEEKKAPEPKITVAQSPRSPDFLSISLAKKPEYSDRVVVMFVIPNLKTTYDQVFTVPSGGVDAAVAASLEVGTKSDIITHQFNDFNNGKFDFVCRKNTYRNRSVYAAKNVYPKGEKQRIGSCTTYFLLSRWATDDATRIEIPLPEAAPGSQDEEFIPQTCSLRVWLVDKDGTRHSDLNVNVERK